MSIIFKMQSCILGYNIAAHHSCKLSCRYCRYPLIFSIAATSSLENAMLSNKKNYSSASIIFFQSLQANLSSWSHGVQRAAEKMTELNVAAANALAAESRAALRQCLLADSPPALMALALTQAQAGVAKARSYARHWRAIVSSIGGDDPAATKSAYGKWSTLPQPAEKKLPAVAGAALTLSDSVGMAPGSDLLTCCAEVPGVPLASFDGADVTDVSEVIQIGDPAARSAILSLGGGR
jgi:hypothetical protein